MTSTFSTPGPAALDRLLAGNERFATSSSSHPNTSAEHRSRLRDGQRPFAAVLGCSDSRVSVELLFDQGFGDVFVVRNAGHVLGRSTQASVEFAVAQLGVEIVLVLGHESCGAVGAAVSFIQEGTTLPGEMPLLVDLVRGHLDASDPQDDPVSHHVRGTIEDLLVQSEIVRDAVGSGQVVVAGGVYALEDGRVRLVEGSGRPAV